MPSFCEILSATFSIYSFHLTATRIAAPARRQASSPAEKGRMAAPSLAPAVDPALRRRAARYEVRAPLDLVALQSGIPCTMPGRCTDLSETGVGVVVAGELLPGQAVALEIRLPNVGLPIRTRAQVRYQNRLQYGLQFVGLSMEHREMIRYWAAQAAPRQEAPRLVEPVSEPELAAIEVAPKKHLRRVRVRRRKFFLAVSIMLAILAFGWWQWERAWNQLETTTGISSEAGEALRVPGEIMDRQILYKVDPVYPDSARVAGTQGLVVLDALIAADGTVKRLRPIAGPDVLAHAAQQAVQAWRYTPYRRDGEAVEVETTVSVDFRLQ